jgi:transposase
MESKRKRRRSSFMTAYQFAFYTLYQSCHWQSSDKFSLWKAGNVLNTLEVAMLFAVVGEINLIERTSYWPKSVLFTSPFLLAALNYQVFDHRGRWKPYAEEFKRYSRAKLLVCRLLFVATVVVMVAMLMVVVSRYTQLHPHLPE